MADLSELFARLKAQSSPSLPPTTQPQASYHNPAVSSPVFSPSTSSPLPHHQIAVTSPGTSIPNTPAPASAMLDQSSADRTANLLNLLKFNQTTGTQSPALDRRPSHASLQHLQAEGHGSSARPVSASDLVASFMKKPVSSTSTHPSAAASHTSGQAESQQFSSIENPQNLLLRLLNHPRVLQSEDTIDYGRNLVRKSSVAQAEAPIAVQFDAITTDPTDINKMEDNGLGPTAETPKHVTDPSTVATKQHDAVSDAVNEAASQARNEADAVLAQAELDEKAQASEELGADVAREESPQNIGTFAKYAETKTRFAADGSPQEAMAESWESADPEDSPSKTDDCILRVYNFPMKPFTSISVQKLQEPATNIRPDIVIDIARLKKEFDQIDRNLVSASKSIIVYALAKQGGFRVIRQETGQYRQVFQGSKERLFNLSLCTATHGAKPLEAETILGTGVNGSVFWASIPIPKTDDGFDVDDLDHGGFILPPAPASDDNTSGGQLKTRAKTSFRHPEFFAVGRGKSIHLIYPKAAQSAHYTDQKTRVCDTEKYLKERTLKIVTGKAGKDFAFSADDSVIVSLDKAGKLRFWDIRDMFDTAYETPSGQFDPIHNKTPIMALQTTSSTDKSWPTSVFFLDKERPITKGIALRYMVVGQKQNHTLQLWDLGLGKAVQELNLPHEKESDAICSVAYHAKTGIMVVGHPTRNSIYFIHVSAPRYNLGVMSQAKYLINLVEKSSNIPKPDSTAIMSGIREYSFASTGQLRSLHMLDEHASSSESYSPGDAPIFELYVMHSKGVTVLGVRREDLGWTDDYRVKHPMDAEACGAVAVNPLRPAMPVTDSSTNGEPRTAASSTSRVTTRESSKRDLTSNSRGVNQTPEATMRATTLAKVESKQDAERAATLIGQDKTDRKKKKKSGDTTLQTSTTQVRATQVPNVSSAISSPSTKDMLQLVHPNVATTTALNGSAAVDGLLQPVASPQTQTHFLPEISDSAINKGLSNRLSTELATALEGKLDLLYQRFDEDKRLQDAAGSAKMDAVLRLVSSTLSENVEKTLRRIVNQNFDNVLLPAMSEKMAATLDGRLSEAIPKVMAGSVSSHVSASLPDALRKALQDPNTVRILTDFVANQTAARVENHIQNITTPALVTVCSNSLKQMSVENDRVLVEQLRQANIRHEEDAARINQLSGTIRELKSTVQSLAVAQAEYRAEILSFQRQLAQNQEAQGGKAGMQGPVPLVSSGDQEIDSIARMISMGQFEEGTIKVSQQKVKRCQTLNIY